MPPATGSDVPVWPVRLMADFDAADERVRQLTNGLSADQLNWQPIAGAWSIGQCLEHLCITNELYLPVISASLAGKPFGRAEEIIAGWLGRWIIRNYADPSPNSRRARAPKRIVPVARIDSSLERFLRCNEAVRELVRRARDYDINRIRFRDPLVPALRLTVGTGLETIYQHELRHLLQAERIGDMADFPV